MTTPRSGSARGAACSPVARSPSDGDLAQGFFYTPTVFADVSVVDAHRPGGDLRPHHRDPPRRLPRRGAGGGQLHPVRSQPEHLHQRPAPRLPRHPRARSPASSTSTRRPSAPRSSFPSAAPRTPATAIARPAATCSTSSASGSRSTSTTAAACSAPRSTPTRSRAHGGAARGTLHHPRGRHGPLPRRWRWAAAGALSRLPGIGGELRDLVRRPGAHPHAGDPRPARLRRRRRRCATRATPPARSPARSRRCATTPASSALRPRRPLPRRLGGDGDAAAATRVRSTGCCCTRRCSPPRWSGVASTCRCARSWRRASSQPSRG